MRGVPTSGYSTLYPILLAPAYALFDALPNAYAFAKATNAVAMSLAAVPAWLVTRRVAGRGLSLLGAAIAVAIPSMAYTATLVTETLFYPIALLFAWTFLRVLERPSGGRIAVLAAALVAALATRSQAIGFVGAILLAPFVLALLRRDVRELRRFVPLLAGTVGAGLLVVVGQLARGRSLSDLLGAYSVVGAGRLRSRPRAPLLALARRGADALRRGGPGRGARRAALAGAAAARRRAGAPGGDGGNGRDVDTRRRCVRVEVRPGPCPGPVPVLPRPAPRRGARRVGRPRRAAAARPARRRLGRGGRAGRRVPLRPVRRRAGEVGHVRPDPALDGRTSTCSPGRTG